ncbi:MAG: hypothetical protein K8L91_31300 [Anaerolineae bacterium]|nr:hypothetical protein [Anaerolineae bacterium]
MKKSWLISLFVVLLGVTSAFGAPHSQAERTPITVENAAQLQPLYTFTGHTGPVFSVAFNYVYDYEFKTPTVLVASGSIDGTARVWDVATGEEKYVLEGHTAQVVAVAFNYFESDGGMHLLTAGYDNLILEWDMADGSLVHEYPTDFAETDPMSFLSINDLNIAFSPRASQFAVTTGAMIEIWDIPSGHYYTIMAEDVVGKIAFSLAEFSPLHDYQDYRLYLVAASNNQVAIYRYLGVEEGYDPEPYVMAGPDTDFYLDKGLAMGFNQNVAVVDDSTSEIQQFTAEGDAGPRLVGHASNENGDLGVYAVAFSPDESLIVSAGYDNQLRLWSHETGEALAVIETTGAGLASVAFSPDGTLIATGDLDGTVTLWGIGE